MAKKAQIETDPVGALAKEISAQSWGEADLTVQWDGSPGVSVIFRGVNENQSGMVQVEINDVPYGSRSVPNPTVTVPISPAAFLKGYRQAKRMGNPILQVEGDGTVKLGGVDIADNEYALSESNEDLFYKFTESSPSGVRFEVQGDQVKQVLSRSQVLPAAGSGRLFVAGSRSNIPPGQVILVEGQEEPGPYAETHAVQGLGQVGERQVPQRNFLSLPFDMGLLRTLLPNLEENRCLFTYMPESGMLHARCGLSSQGQYSRESLIAPLEDPLTRSEVEGFSRALEDSQLKIAQRHLPGLGLALEVGGTVVLAQDMGGSRFANSYVYALNMESDQAMLRSSSGGLSSYQARESGEYGETSRGELPSKVAYSVAASALEGAMKKVGCEAVGENACSVRVDATGEQPHLIVSSLGIEPSNLGPRLRSSVALPIEEVPLRDVGYYEELLVALREGEAVGKVTLRARATEDLGQALRRTDFRKFETGSLRFADTVLVCGEEGEGNEYCLNTGWGVGDVAPGTAVRVDLRKFSAGLNSLIADAGEDLRGCDFEPTVGGPVRVSCDVRGGMSQFFLNNLPAEGDARGEQTIVPMKKRKISG